MNLMYLINMIVGIIYIILGLYIFNKCKNLNDNLILFLLSLIIVIAYILTILFSIKPAFGYNMQFVYPISNVSPFLFTLVFISIFLSSKYKHILYKFFIMFWIAMLIAAFFTSFLCLIQSFPSYNFIYTDVYSHATFFLLTYYIIKNNIVKLSKKDFIYSYIFILCLILLIVIINLIFNRSFFGLALNDLCNIYGYKLFINPYTNLILYTLGLSIIMYGNYLLYKTYIKNK